MKVSSLFLSLLTAASTASAISLFGGEQNAMVDEDKFEVPGKNPLTVRSSWTVAIVSILTRLQFCANPKDYILTVDYVDLSPNPPLPYVSTDAVDMERSRLTIHAEVKN